MAFQFPLFKLRLLPGMQPLLQLLRADKICCTRGDGRLSTIGNSRGTPLLQKLRRRSRGMPFDFALQYVHFRAFSSDIDCELCTKVNDFSNIRFVGGTATANRQTDNRRSYKGIGNQAEADSTEERADPSVPDPPARVRPARSSSSSALSRIPSETLAEELQHRGWIVVAP